MGYLSLMLLAGVVVTAHRAQGTKQVGETCGSCFNPEANFDCGKCVPGLECVKEYKVKYFVKDDESDLLPDLPSRCRVTLVFPRGGEVGDDCGPCFNPSANFDCGECRPGLECGATNPLLPDAPGKCQFARPPIPSGDARCNGKNCGDTCGMGMRQMPAPNAPDGVAICNSKGECSTDFDNLGCEKDPKGALWEQETRGMRCQSSTRFRFVSKFECQTKCEAISSCPGISYKYARARRSLCFVCTNDVLRPVHFGRIVFYRKQAAPATNVATAPSTAN